MSITHEHSSLRSMTGFARASVSDGNVDIDVETRSVNSRFLEVVFKAPRCFSSLEREVKGMLQKNHRRGRIEVSIMRVSRVSDFAAGPNWDETDRAVAAYAAACKRYGVRGDSLAEFLATLLIRQELAPLDQPVVKDEELNLVLGAISEASQELVRARQAEGKGLYEDISSRVGTLRRVRDQIGSAMSGASERLRDRMRERLKLLTEEVAVDPARLAEEVALLADRVDVAEELSRLEIHLGQFSSTLLGHTDGVGRKLDFMTQEIGRELNTIGSKAQDAFVQGLVVDAKTELERIREQVQNVE
jgi:uncharacterized protein (TIGR00255 family)